MHNIMYSRMFHHFTKNAAKIIIIIILLEVITYILFKLHSTFGLKSCGYLVGQKYQEIGKKYLFLTSELHIITSPSYVAQGKFCNLFDKTIDRFASFRYWRVRKTYFEKEVKHILSLSSKNYSSRTNLYRDLKLCVYFVYNNDKKSIEYQ